MGLGALGVALAGCSSDALDPSAPTFADPGTFVAVEESPGQLTLYRCIDTFTVEGDVTLFIRSYDVAPRTVDEARELARHGELPVREPTIAVALTRFPGAPFWIVWFRTLTEDEIALSL